MWMHMHLLIFPVLMLTLLAPGALVSAWSCLDSSFQDIASPEVKRERAFVASGCNGALKDYETYLNNELVPEERELLGLLPSTGLPAGGKASTGRRLTGSGADRWSRSAVTPL
jgi:hypothetical protein